MTDTSPDAVVIGSGVFGSAIAFELAKAGYRTVVVDKNPAPGYGSTSNSSGIIRFSYSTREGVAMSYEGLGYWQNWRDHIGVVDDGDLATFIRCGTVHLKDEQDEQWRVCASHYETVGVPYEDWDLDTLLDRFPLFDPRSFRPPRRPDDPHFWDEPSGSILGAIFTPDSGYIGAPQMAARNLADAAIAHGATFRQREQVVEILRGPDRVRGVTLASGERIDAPIVVNAAGPYSSTINRMAGVDDDMKIGTRALRHEVHHVPSPATFDFEHRGAHIADADTGVYFRPEVGNHILVGGMDAECDEKVWVDDPDDFPDRVTRDEWDTYVLRLARRIPDLPIPGRPSGVVDLYDVSDDWIPIYDRSSLDGFYMAIGTSGNQFKNAPVAAYCMTRLIDAVENGLDHDADPLPVAQRYRDYELDMGFYSRLREINPESSFSVNG